MRAYIYISQEGNSENTKSSSKSGSLDDPPLPCVQSLLRWHPHSTDLEMLEVLLQIHRRRLHLLDHVEDLLDIAFTELVAAKAHHPTTIAALRNDEVARVEELVVKMVPCLPGHV